MLNNNESKTSFVLGLTIGIAVISTVGFFVLLLGGSSLGSLTNKAAVPTNTNTNTNQAAAAPTQPSEPAESFSQVPAVTDGDHIRGDKNAQITMIEYSDFQCPFCQRHLPTLDQILSDYQGQVRLVYRHFPLNSIHAQAQKAAEASECAAEQGKFWEYHDLLFDNQSALQVDNLKSYAKNLGLNQSQFDSCLDSGKYTAKVNQQAQEAVASGITGTPGTWVNDQLVKGAYPVATFKQIIDGMLSE